MVDEKAAESSEEVQADPNKAPEDFMAGVEAAMEASEHANEPVEERIEREEKEKSDSDRLSSSKDNQEDTSDDKDESGKAGDDEKSIPDELLERAVKSGISLKDAQQMPNAEMLTRMVENVEKVAKEAKSDSDDDVSGDDEAKEGDILSKIPDFDPDEYDDEIVNAFKAVKEIISEQNKTIEDLKKSGSSEKTIIDLQIADLGKEYDGFFDDAEKRDKLEAYYKLISDVEGEDLNPKQVFEKALDAGFGDKVKSVKGMDVAKASQRRAKNAINRPRDLNGKFSAERKNDDVLTEAEAEAEAIAEIQAMMDAN